MPKGLRKPMDEMLLGTEGGKGGVGGGGGSGFNFGPRVTGKRSAKDYREKLDYEPEISGKINFPSSRSRYEVPEDRTPRTSDDYKKGGMTASKRADGIAQRGKTRGQMR